jgi:type II secretory pathway pseudopilin PulG
MNQNTLMPRRLPQSMASVRGFSLIEALIALLVVSFGMMGIAAFNFTLSRSADLAKQRTEATRIAEKEVDRLRSFVQTAPDLNTGDAQLTYAEDLAVGTTLLTQVQGENATFRPQRVISLPTGSVPTEGETYRWVTMNVRWLDRTGVDQLVTLATTISSNGVADLGPLGTGRSTSNTLRPKNRNINIPYPAVNLAGNTQSAFIPPPGNVIYVFNNLTGNVEAQCSAATVNIASFAAVAGSRAVTVTSQSATQPFLVGNRVTIAGASNNVFNGTFIVTGSPAANQFTYSAVTAFATNTTATGGTATIVLTEGTALAALTCTPLNAFIASGYVRFVDVNNVNADDLINPTGNTFDLLSTGPLTISQAGTGSANAPTSTPQCYAQRQIVRSYGVNVASRGISSLNRVGGTATINVSGNSNHGFVVGMLVAVTVTDPSNATFQGQFEILQVTGNAITVADGAPDASSTNSGTMTLSFIQQITIADTLTFPSAYNTVVSRFVAYTCIVEPPTVNGERQWWGQLNLVPETSSVGGRVPWTGIAAGLPLGNWRVCRYSFDYNGNGRLSNLEHPAIYRKIIGALDNQNFVVIRSAQSCPTDTAPNFNSNQAGDLNNTNTFSHQPGTATSSTGEPASATDELDME